MSTAEMAVEIEADSPCDACDTLYGHIPKGHYRPARYDGSRFGFGPESVLCGRCYDHHRKGCRRHICHKRMRAEAAPPPVDDHGCGAAVHAAPCALCKTTGGHVLAGWRRPRRSSGQRFGIDGVLCARCYQKQDRIHAIKHRSGQPTAQEPRPGPLMRFVEPRVKAVRAVKRLKESLGLMPILTRAELRRALPAGLDAGIAQTAGSGGGFVLGVMESTA